MILRYFVVTATTLLCLGGTLVYEDSRPTPYSPEYGPDCALIVTTTKPHAAIIQKPPLGSTSGLQYISNFVPQLKAVALTEGQQCITYEDVNQAVLEAKAKFGEDVPHEIYELSSDSPTPEHVTVPAEIIQEASKVLARRFSLSYHAIVYGLPQIDTTKTVVKDICPTFLRPVKCELSRYRTLTGMCNNLDNPSWGSVRAAMVRYLPPAYADGISEPRVAKDGGPLPNPRMVSFLVHHDVSEHDRRVRNLLVAFGQMLDHDLTLAAPTLDTERQDIECCKYAPEDRHPNCMGIDIPHDDPFYKFFNRKCLDFARILAGLRPSCTLGPRSQMNTLSSFIDAGFVYGGTQEIASRLREFSGGRLKSTPLYRDLGLKDMLPMKTVEADVGCMARPRSLYCFDAGDERVNEQLALTVMHTLWMREHNKIAGHFQEMNPHWDDETLYQEARHLLVAEVQHIVINEWLPMIIGPDTVKKYGLVPSQGYYDGYSSKVNAGIRQAFQSAVFRFGHSLLPDVTERYNKFHEKLEAIRLSRLLRQPYDLYKPGVMDTFIMGLVNQQSNRMDPEITTEVTNHLFEKPGDGFGMDLVSLNVQRARETGVPGYNDFREYCGLPRARDFWDLVGYLPNKTIHRYTQVYKHVDDIDLWSAGVSEYGLPGAVTGPTFACLIGEQFANIRRGDRFWYENPGWPSSFTLEQLHEIRKVRLCRLLCDNADDMYDVQFSALVNHDPGANPRINCASPEMPKMDLSKWKDTTYLKK
ncbi:chorion peroxidase [Ixodes scapularis]|uniref:chorion peroxidase n=1 Tax=Ixodes scapularis TaxID=6945 RepID=UPI001161A4D1|nr:chorion peroxidase [Ixodes scapularis]